MKRLISALVLIILLLSLAGCSSPADTEVSESPAPESNPVAETSSPSDSQPAEDVPVSPHDLDHPDVVAIYDMLDRAIRENEMPFTLDGSISSGWDDESEIEFFFTMQYDDVIDDQYIVVTVYAFDGVVQNGFEIYLDRTYEDYVLKDAVICAILAVDPTLDYRRAEEYMNQMVDGFTGDGRSNILTLNGYRLHLSEGVLHRGYPLLHVIAEDAIHPGDNVSKYQDHTIEELQNVSNVGEYSRLTGSIKKVYEEDDHCILEVVSDGATIGVYCNPDTFTDCFTVGQKYEFFGQIARARDGYDACLKLNSFQKN